MAERPGRVCDNCPDEVVIGTLARPLMYIVVGHYEAGVVPDAARLPKFAWDIYMYYNEEADALDLHPLPRAEFCADCWGKKLAAKGATKVITLGEFLINERAACGVPPEGRPPPEPESPSESPPEGLVK